MKGPILVVDLNEEQCGKLCALLEEHNYRSVPLRSFTDLEHYLRNNRCLAVLLDIDTVKIDNRVIKKFALNNPEVHVLSLTDRRYNPELKEAICDHFYACINKPIDPDELVYLLRSIDEEK